jgi:dGTPase
MSSIREEIEEKEKKILSPFATFSANTRGRIKKEKKCQIRTEFQRDRDRIIHSKSFRRLRYKTQVFLAPKGDHYRTRLTHTLEVSQIARVISRALGLNEDLTEAISLGHDLGHTPFGHAGETVLNKLLKNGFRHNEQSLRVVDIIEKDGKGLNLTFEVRDGILKHSKGRGPIFIEDNTQKPLTLEGEVVRIADLIAYLCHDLDDALRAKVIKESQIPRDILKYLGNSHSKRINHIVKDIIYETKKSEYSRISMSKKMYEIVITLRNFLFKYVYESDIVHREFLKAEKILEQLFYFFMKNEKVFYNIASPLHSGDLETQVADFISGMTDRYSLFLYEKLFLPEPWNVL